MFAMGPKKRPAAKKVVKKATISKTAADVVTTKTRFNPRKFLEILLSRGSKKENGKVLQWASCCDGSNCPGYVLVCEAVTCLEFWPQVDGMDHGSSTDKMSS